MKWKSGRIPTVPYVDSQWPRAPFVPEDAPGPRVSNSDQSLVLSLACVGPETLILEAEGKILRDIVLSNQVLSRKMVGENSRELLASIAMISNEDTAPLMRLTETILSTAVRSPSRVEKNHR